MIPAAWLLLAATGCAEVEDLLDSWLGDDGPVDADGDGYAAGYDCDDQDPAVNGGATEIPDNGVDDDCDPGTPDGSETIGPTDTGETDTTPVDADQDGHASDTDCDDRDAGVFPGAEELCDDRDQDCDGVVDEGGVDQRTFWADYDGDGWGNEVVSEQACSHPGSGWTELEGDCNDGDSGIHPEAEETCDKLDQDCDDAVDEDPSDATVYYSDDDRDGYGDPDDGAASCDQPPDTVTNDEDCDDDDVTVHPGRDEVCNDGVDNDCDGTANGCGLSGTVGLDSADARYEGASGGDFLGSTLTPLGDQDGDGFADFAASSPGLVSETGRIYVVPGGGAGGAVASVSLAHLNGANTGDQAGWSMASADVDGDGVVDLAVGAPGLDGGGGAYVALGPLGTGGVKGAASLRLEGGDTASYAGWSVALVDGDPVIGAPYTAGGGTVYRWAWTTGVKELSTATGTVSASSEDEGLGISVAGAGDLDGDGVEDLVIGAFLEDSGDTDAGAALIFTTPLSGSLDASDADALLTGETAFDRAGWTVRGAGDLDDDGLGDVLIGAIYHDGGGGQAGAVYVVSHLPSGEVSLSDADAVLIGDASGDQAGYAAAAAGDVDGDGKGDVVIGSPYSDRTDSQSGVAHLVNGPMTGTVDLGAAHAELLGESQGDYAGIAVGGPGDLDGDGLEDLAVGAYGWDSQAGAVYVVLATDRL